MKKKNIIIIVVAVLGIILLIGGGSYAFFNYYQVSNISNVLIAGDIRMSIQEGSDTITLTNVFPETKEEARSHDGNTLTFTLSGANTSSKAIGYNILLNDGTSKAGKIRFLPNELRFDLVEIIDNNEVYLVENANYNTLSDTSIYDNVVPGNTNSVSHTYKIRVWVDENVIISETESGNHVYTPSEYKNLYATVKIAVKGETQDGSMYTVTFDADGGNVPVSTKNVIVGNNYGILPTPTKEGYTFLGWNGKNMFNERDILMAIDGAVYENGYYVFDSIKAYNIYRANNQTLPIAFNDGKQYTYTITGHVDSPSTYFGFLHKNTSVIESNTLNKLNDETINITSNVNYDVSGSFISFGTGNLTYISQIQLEEGETATEYEPYFVTSDVKVTQEKNHTLKAIWRANS